MRRAEKAGREAAERELARWADSKYKAARIDQALGTSTFMPQHSPARVMWEVSDEAFRRDTGSLNVSGRAWLAILEAYDRGYRTRLREALEGLVKP